MKKSLVFAILVLSACGPSLRDERVRSYNRALASPIATFDTYSNAYTRHNVHCKAGEKQFCTEAKADLALVKQSQQQMLSIYQQMAADPDVNPQDRAFAQKQINGFQPEQ
jgi:hypothetical protein